MARKVINVYRSNGKRKQDKDKAIIQNMEISCQRSIIKKDIEGKDNGNNI